MRCSRRRTAPSTGRSRRGATASSRRRRSRPPDRRRDMAEQTSPRIPYRYTFRRADGRQKQFDVQLDYDNLAVVPVPRDSYPDWTQLSYCQCPNCPLQQDAHPRCPIAVNLVDVAEFFGDALSYEPMEVTVEAAGRTYSKKTSLQDAVSSLIGIFM